MGKKYLGHQDRAVNKRGLACQQARSRSPGKRFVSYERNVTFQLFSWRDLASKLVKMFSR